MLYQCGCKLLVLNVLGPKDITKAYSVLCCNSLVTEILRTATLCLMFAFLFIVVAMYKTITTQHNRIGRYLLIHDNNKKSIIYIEYTTTA